MQRLEVVLTKQADGDLQDIFRFLLGLGASVASAENFIRQISARCRRIGDAPMGGRRRDDLTPGLRMVGFERREVIMYRVADERVWIQRVFYGGYDYARAFRNDVGDTLT